MVRYLIGILLLFLPLHASAQSPLTHEQLLGVWQNQVNNTHTFQRVFRTDGTGAANRILDGEAVFEQPFDWSIFSTVDGPDGHPVTVLRRIEPNRGAMYQLAEIDRSGRLHLGLGHDAVPTEYVFVQAFDRVEAFPPRPFEWGEPSLHDINEADFLGAWEAETNEHHVRLTIRPGRHAAICGADDRFPFHWAVTAEAVIDQTDVLLVELHVGGELMVAAAVFDGPDRLLVTGGRPPTSLSHAVTFTRVDPAVPAAEAEAATQGEAGVGTTARPAPCDTTPMRWRD